MLRSLWLIIQIAIPAGLLIWAAQYPGTVQIKWLTYDLNLQIGFVLCGLYALIVCTVLLHSIWSKLSAIPAALIAKLVENAKHSSFNNLAKGLSALAAGDAKTAQKMIHKISPAHVEETAGLLLLLQAQTARLEGRDQESTRLFSTLSKDKNAGFLGLRALLQNALERGDFTQARKLVDDGLNRFSGNPWLLQAAYKIALQDHKWDEALSHLGKLERTAILPAQTVQSDRCCLLIIQADESKGSNAGRSLKLLHQAYKSHKAFPPLIERLAQAYSEKGKQSKARSIVKAAWKAAPHRALIPLWASLQPRSKNSSASETLKWFETLHRLAPLASESHYARALAAQRCHLWGDAREHFLKAKALSPNAQPDRYWYDAMARLEREENHNEDAAQEWLIQKTTAPEDKVWICTQTGQIYPQWHPLAPPHNSFNTIRWQRPLDSINAAALTQIQGTERLAGLLG